MSYNYSANKTTPELCLTNAMRFCFDQMKFGIAIRDLSTRLVYCNQKLANIADKSPKEIIGKLDIEIDSKIVDSEEAIEAFDKQYKQIFETQKPFSTLEIHPHALDFPFIFHKAPFYNDEQECVGMVGYNTYLTIYSLNDYVKGHMPGSLLLNKPDDFFTERECEVMFYRLQGMKAKDAASRLNLPLHTFNNHMRLLYDKVNATNIDEFKEFCIKRNYNRYLPKRFLTSEAINFSSSII